MSSAVMPPLIPSRTALNAARIDLTTHSISDVYAMKQGLCRTQRRQTVVEYHRDGGLCGVLIEEGSALEGHLGAWAAIER